ncbi:hypothetical protein TNCV_494681 [Trichonephila clavipes]|nr:hypothetical protein TNCV_494681 [Trichonephila clavipes]
MLLSHPSASRGGVVLNLGHDTNGDSFGTPQTNGTRRPLDFAMTDGPMDFTARESCFPDGKIAWSCVLVVVLERRSGV